MNEKGVDSSKSEVLKEESKEEVQKESKEEESTGKRKLGTRKKMKSRKRRYIQNTSEDDSKKDNDELRLHLTIAPDEEKEVDYEILDRKYPIKEWKTKCLGTKPQIDQTNRNTLKSNESKIEDLNAVYQLVMDRYQDEIPEGFDRFGRRIPLRKKYYANAELKLESIEEHTMAIGVNQVIKNMLTRVEPKE
ncbi:hypothetical protein Tco_0573674 [Tanacetum coccineum]